MNKAERTESGEIDQPLIQTKLRGTLQQEYDNYCSCAVSLGWYVKSFDEWLGS